MAYLTDRKRAVGLGSGRKGTEHHWQMMASSMAMVVMVPLFVVTFGLGLGGTYEEVLAYFSRPLPVIITGLTLVVVVFHCMNEVLEAVEDYVHGVPGMVTLVCVKGISYALIGIGLFALARLAI